MSITERLELNKRVLAFSGLKITDDDVRYEDLIKILYPEEIFRFPDNYNPFTIHPLVMDALLNDDPFVIDHSTQVRCSLAALTGGCKINADGAAEQISFVLETQEDLDKVLEQGWSLYTKVGNVFEFVFANENKEHLELVVNKRLGWDNLILMAIEAEIESTCKWSVPKLFTNTDQFVRPFTVDANDWKGDAVVEKVLEGDATMDSGAFVARYVEIFFESLLNEIFEKLAKKPWSIFFATAKHGKIELWRCGDARAFMWLRDNANRIAEKEDAES